MERFRNKYRIASARAQWWDYGWNGAYFITICSKNREHYFGEILGSKMNLSKTGIIADIFWHEIPHHSPIVELGDYVVMPNHIHGILILNNPDLVSNNRNAQTNGNARRDVACNVSTTSISPKSNTVSAIVRSYKSAVTRHSNRLGLPNGWQARFYDRIIRDYDEYQRISEYIINNPANWQRDRFK